MAKAAFFNIPAYDHIQPTLSVIDELTRRGEDIIYYATEPYQAQIEAAGATFVPYDETMPDDLLAETNPLRLSVRMAETTQALLPGLLDHLKTERPDYLIFDSRCAWGWYTAQIVQLPAISSMTLLMLNSNILIHSGKLLSTLQQTLESLPILARYREVLMELEQTYGVNGPGITEILNNTGALTICYTSEQFQPYAASFGRSVRFVGPALRDHKPATPADNPMVCAVNIEPADYADALAGDSWTLAFADPVTLLDVLPQASVCITTGSMRVVQAALYYDVPLVVLPQTIEQSLAGQQVASLGVGLKLDDFSPAQVRSAVEIVLTNPDYRQKTAEIGASLRAAGGYQRAADEILAFIATHRGL